MVGSQEIQRRQGFVPAAAGTDGLGRVGSQEIQRRQGFVPAAAGTDGLGRVGSHGGAPQPVTDNGSEPHPGTDGEGGKQPQCKNKNGNRRKKLTESTLGPTIIKVKPLFCP
ncbi:uncharacterized protein LOC124669453 [Lolium rigidum]|uniref:uncharacterized protein LOC124669453 n=1 Tax=Lolium rigidum TaxID=89674 RepID=UPI001F5D77A4|nr:uncharacterized protein LOC124669453 [Lolium rigidum]